MLPCVWLNWSCGICWAMIESDNFCRNCCLVFSPLFLSFFAPFLTSFVFNFFWFQAPPGKSPDRDGASDPDVDKKGLDSEMDMV